MYIFILWNCLLTSPECPLWQSQNNIVVITKVEDRKACETLWRLSERIPDPDGTISRHKCQPISEEL